MLAIVTGTIRPAAQMCQLVLRDDKERLKQYEEGIRSLLESRAFSRIVFCENSGYGTKELSRLLRLAGEKGIELELLSFQGNTEEACIHGKGYGEGEIMAYVFSHSRLAAREPYFVKITGRLKLDRAGDLVRCISQEKTYFNIPNRTRRDFYDTRIYAMSSGLFRQFFLDAYDQVMDDQGMILEILYTRILLENNIRVTNFPIYPRIVGISGSGGLIYSYTEWKCRIRDVLGRFNFYRVRKQ